MIRLFTTGTHKGISYTRDNLNAIFSSTKEKGVEKIPFVLGHPKNDLPVLGLIDKSKIQLYTEGENTSIGFNREDAEFSEESIDVLRSKKANKISIRLKEGVIQHIGLVDNPAVLANQSQDFSNNADCQGADDFEDNSNGGLVGRLNQIENTLKNIFKIQKKETDNMGNTQDFNAEIASLKSENEALKKQLEEANKINADFSRAETDAFKESLQSKIKELNFDETKSKEVQEFGEKLLAKDKCLFAEWLSKLEPARKVEVKNGSVVNGEFSQKSSTNPEDEFRKQFEQAKQK